MTSDTERLEELLFHCLDLPTEQRSAFLREKAGWEPHLAEQLEALLDFAATTTDVGMAGGSARNPPTAPQSQLRMGPYSAIRFLGRGGSASVFLAAPPDRPDSRVALKVLDYPMPELVTRFNLERRVLECLDHPNILKTLDSGTLDDGRPFFVMPVVSGRHLDTYCSGARFALKDRLALFLKVCEAVRHCHSNRVVHRDLKPRNILVKRSGEPILLDFGLAGFVDSVAELQLSGKRWLTPDYAGPEQIRGIEAGFSSDIYSLGVILHQLITGDLPQDAAGCSLWSNLLKGKPWTPRPPSSVAASPHHDSGPSRSAHLPHAKEIHESGLDRIVLKALQPDRSRRYGTVQDLMADLEKVRLRLEAMPNPHMPLLRPWQLKWQLRSRWPGLALGVLLLAGAAIPFLHMTFELAEQRRLAAETIAILTHSLGAASPATSSSPDRGIEEILVNAEQRVKEDFPQASEAKAQILAAMGGLQHGLGNYEKAAGLLQQARQQLRRLGKTQSHEYLEVLGGLTNCATYLGDFSLADETGSEALQLVKSLPDDLPKVSRVLAHLAVNFVNQRRYGEALEIHRHREELLARHPGAGPLDRALVRCHHAHALTLSGQPAWAARILSPLAEEFPTLRESDPELYLSCHEILGLALVQSGETQHGLQLLEKAVDFADRHFANNLSLRARLQSRVVHGSWLQEDYQRAEQSLLMALRLQEAGDSHPQAMRVFLRNLSLVYLKLENHSSAVEAMERLLGGIDPGEQVSAVDSIKYQCTYARALFFNGEHEPSKQVFDRAMNIALDLLQAEDLYDSGFQQIAECTETGALMFQSDGQAEIATELQKIGEGLRSCARELPHRLAEPGRQKSYLMAPAG